jgi:uncharacterized heparinase superfamily protein
VAIANERTTLRPWPLQIGRRDSLPESLRPAADQLIAEADDVVGGRMDILGSGLAQVGPAVDWHRDFKSGYRWPEVFFMDVPITRLDDDSDAKVPWDLSRCHHLLTLARAAQLTGDARYAHEAERQLTSWLDGNPAGVGINWTQPMEIALRAVNWVWTLRTLEPAFPISEPLRRRLLTSLRAHAKHVSTTLEGSPDLRSNHYLADVLGLIVLGAVLAGGSSNERWLRYGRRAFAREVRRQVLADGMSFEASVGYHGLVLEMFLLARLVADWRGVPLGEDYDWRLRRMLDASRVLRHPDGLVPLFGDVDSGRVLPGGFARPPSHDPMLALGSSILGLDRLVEGDPSPEVAWTVGSEAWEEVANRPLERSALSSSLPEAGIYVLRRDHWRVVVRCGNVGQNGNGGHAHNDIGSYELVRNARFVIDPGNYAYTFDPVARNEFRSTRAHNTVMVDGEEINPIPAELFRLPQFAHPTVTCWRSEPPQSLLVSHDGYRRLVGSPAHMRHVEIAADGSGVSVIDTVEGGGEHLVECNVHLAFGVTPEHIGPRTFALRHTSGEQITVQFAGDGLAIEVRDGWVAPEYGVRHRSKVLVVTRTGRLPARFEHRYAVVEA